MKRSREETSSRWLRLLIGVPFAVLGGVVLSVALGAGAANANETHDSGLGGSIGSLTGDATDLVGDVVGDTKSTASLATHSAIDVVTTAPKKPVTVVVESVVKVVPATTQSVSTTVVNLLDNTSTTVETVTDDVLPSVLQAVPDVTGPVLDPGVITDLPHQLSPAFDSIAATPIAASTASAVALVQPPEQSSTAGSANGIPLRFPSGPAPLGVVAPTSSTSGGSANGHAPASIVTFSTGFGPASAGATTTPESDELPSTPTFDTDTSPD